MKKKFDIFGRKVPVLAVMMVILVIGTASAAIFTNYATLSGDVTVDTGISVNGIPLDDVGDLVFSDQSASFTINNAGDEAVNIWLVTTIYEVDAYGDIIGEPLTITDGFDIVYSIGNGDALINPVSIPADGTTTEGTDIDVEFSAPSNVVGDYRIIVEVNPVL